ncbi:sensor domain-containing diguanylate cyclase [Nitrospirillum sp. BR 11828]|uniref:sensor domain-containing diguanylate cyclase n=1 Tax=Nitrospirillum sp. BR 11828 TaxID=3104325 RepID=UPI002ACAD074|nr:sensor domain-containing diguanylate cyclase [Nitrospirillum sp. BR 11828]MDZ5646490.1 sensor domain-containing diguanylate cyclase [Nitrospirillum sp. BR 11828]
MGSDMHDDRSAAREVDSQALLMGWAGPGLAMDAAGAVTAANPAGAQLLTRDDGWLDLLSRWVADGGALQPGTHSSPLPDQEVVEWTPLALPPQVDGPDGNRQGGNGQPRYLLLGRMATLERRLRQALTESRQRYKDLVEISSDFAWETGPDGRFAFVSPAGAIGYRPDNLVGRHPHDFLLPEFDDGLSPFEAREPIERVEVWLRAADGRPACLISSALPLTGPDGRWAGARGACRDITDARLRAMELAQVRLREQYLGYIVSSTRDDVDPARTLEIAAGVAVNATGAAGSALRARTVGTTDYTPVGTPVGAEERIPPELEDILAGLPQRAAGSEGAVTVTAAGYDVLAARTLFRHEVNGAVLVWRPAADTETAGDTSGEGAKASGWSADDLSMVRTIADHVGAAIAQARYQERLKTLSERDGLTGLYNRRTVMELLGQRLGAKTGGSSALLYFDLDNFKAVNDLRGHTAGDDVLRAVGDLLRRMARPGDLAGRLGGDEFVLWVDRVDEDQALSVADRLLREAAEFLRPLSAGPEKPLGVSVGVAVHQGGGAEPVQSLVDRGDQGMYAAKRLGKGHRTLAPAYSDDTGKEAPGEPGEKDL